MCIVSCVCLLGVLGEREFLNEWLLEIPAGKDAALSVAKDYHYELIKEVTTTYDEIYGIRYTK